VHLGEIGGAICFQIKAWHGHAASRGWQKLAKKTAGVVPAAFIHDMGIS
jgi:hypothetical protein